MALITQNSKWAGFVLSLLILAVSAGCEIDMRIKIDGKNPPTFTLSGSGNIVFLYVMKVPSNRLPTVEDPKLWEIHPTTKDRISDLPPITYGTVPNGFSQTTPGLGQPPGLVEGQTYEVGGPAYNANGGSSWFVIKEGKSVPIPKPENYP
jgi:hypothetical protein